MTFGFIYSFATITIQLHRDVQLLNCAIQSMIQILLCYPVYLLYITLICIVDLHFILYTVLLMWLSLSLYRKKMQECTFFPFVNIFFWTTQLCALCSFKCQILWHFYAAIVFTHPPVCMSLYSAPKCLHWKPYTGPKSPSSRSVNPFLSRNSREPLASQIFTPFSESSLAFVEPYKKDPC